MAQETLITEEMKKAMGSLVNIAVNQIERIKVKMYCEAIKDSNPLWQDEEYAIKAGFGKPVVPPGFLTTMQMEGESPGFYMTYMYALKGAIDAGGEWEFFKPVRIGDVIIVDRRYVSSFEKKGSLGTMLFNQFETTYRNQKGEIIAKGKWSGIRIPAPEVKDYEGKKVD